MLKKVIQLVLCLILLVFYSVSYAESRYFLCGSDEDGCFLDQVQYCACIPLSEIHYAEPYCLDFDNMRCESLSETPNCPSQIIFKDQGRCLATIHQSEPEPPCSITSRSFCLENHAWICDESGNPKSCKPS